MNQKIWSGGKGFFPNSRISMFPLIVNCKYVIRQGAGRVFSNDIWQCTLRKYSMQGNKPESRFVQRVNSHEGCWYHSRQDHDPQFNAEQSNQTARRHTPHLSVPRNDIPRCPAINLNLVLSKESTARRDVSTTVDKTTIPR